MTGVQVPITETLWAVLSAFALTFAGAEAVRAWGSPEFAPWAAVSVLAANGLLDYVWSRS